MKRISVANKEKECKKSQAARCRTSATRNNADRASLMQRGAGAAAVLTNTPAPLLRLLRDGAR
tara:strand:+ start:96 stop:284 length:189 start_codon:yes stop_codon:yes gene_type:complete